ncbi:MAG: CHASE2 domain-containing protein [Candidatus Omnitrophota bacterium]
MKKFNGAKLIFFITGLFLAALFLALSYFRVFDEFEYSMIDIRYSLRPPQKVDKDIVIVEIADDSIEKIGKWPFPRNYHALLVRALSSAGAKNIIFDVFFSEKKEEDEQFAGSVKDAGNVYLPYVFDLDRDNPDKTFVRASGYAAPLIEVLREAAYRTGFINVVPDADGKVRRIPPFIGYKGAFYPHLTVLAAINDLGYDFDRVKITPGREIRAGKDLVIPLEKDSSVLVDYPAVWGKAFRHYSYIDIIQSYLADVTGQKPVMDLKELNGAVCFIGITSTAAPDAHPSPMEPLYPGIGVHASLYNSILQKSFISRLSREWSLAVLIFMWAATVFVTSRGKRRFSLLAIFMLMAGYFLAAVAVFQFFGLWINVFYPMISMAAIYAVYTLKRYVIESQKRELLENELNIARGIQQSFLPGNMPEVEGISISVDMVTARQVGGDLYDVIQLDDKKIGVMFGDVSGKGVPAALYMARAVSIFKTFVRDGSPEEVLRKVNNRLVLEDSSGLFVTLTFAVIDAAAKRTVYAIGGHMPTILVGPDGSVELLDVSEGMPLGMIDCDFARGEKEYEPGSIFIFYTDGVTEAMNTHEEMFGMERLTALAATLKGRSAEEAVRAITGAVTAFEGKAKQHDDITVMAVKV